MRFLRVIPLLFLMAVSAVAAPKEIEIPKAGWVGIFFESINELSKQAKWTPLREVEINDGEHYRTYKYGNPQYQEWPEAKKIIEVIKVLEEELLQPLKKE